jgi:two-component system cell cycle sensor histidine kinase/response regulator CckA
MIPPPAESAPRPDRETPLRILVVEDSADDAELVTMALKRAGLRADIRRVDTSAAFVQALGGDWDAILADYHLPSFSAPEALALRNQHAPDVPFIVVSGSVGEETAVAVLKSGASDYLLKDRLARLGQAVTRAIEEQRVQRDKRRVEAALNAAEARMRFALDAARVGIWEADLRSGAVVWSETLESLHGLVPRTFGGTFADFLACIHPDDRSHMREVIGRPSRDGADSDVLYRTIWPDGSTRWIAGRGRTFFDADGAPLRAAGIGWDVTDHRQLEEQYRQAQKMEAVGLLAGGVAHDFNNLLTAIHGYGSLVSEALGPASPHQDDLKEILDASDRATRLTRQLLTFSRRQPTEPRVLDLRESLDSLERMLGRLIREDVRIDVRGTPSGRVRADPGQIEQVVINLAVNARDAMPNGGTLVFDLADRTLADDGSSRDPVPPGNYVEMRVTDTGTGMDQATQARVFEPFFTTKPKGHGTGLGLSTVYGIVAQHGGHIWIESAPGRGTTFHVFFPRVTDPIEAARPAAVVTGNTGTETILVVEDEDAVRRLAARVLAEHGYHVLVAATPGEAIGMAHAFAQPIHLLLSDVVMPDLDGPALADRLTDARPDLRVLYMTGHADSRPRVTRRETSPPVIQKPFAADTLLHRVREVLDAGVRL